MAPALRAAGVDLDAVRADTAPVVSRAPRSRAAGDAQGLACCSRSRAPNTVGILEGSDPPLKNEYLVFSAHMDHIGITPGQPDSINNGADDDGSGTAGVMELAEAFSRPGARPKRSIIFLTVSGEEKGLWGSGYFTEHPPVPIDQIVADLNIDMIGRNWPDTIVAIGKEHSDLGATLERVNARAPRAPHDRHRRPVARGALLLPLRPLQLRPQGRADPVLLQRGAPGLPRGRPTRPTRSTARRSPGSCGCCTTWAGTSGTRADRPQWKPESYQRDRGGQPGADILPPWRTADSGQRSAGWTAAAVQCGDTSSRRRGLLERPTLRRPPGAASLRSRAAAA